MPLVRSASWANLALLLATTAACHDDHDHGNEEEVITTVTLTFTPAGGGSAVVAVFDDPDGDGGNAPTVDAIALASGTTYAVTVGFQNKLEDPPEEITDEVRDEGDEHQVFFTGSAVDGPASDRPGAPLTHTYTDVDGGGLPIGLESSVVAATGTGQLTITLRHLPPVNGTAVKTSTLAEMVKASGFASIGGENDVQVNFDVAVP